jgi:hypothetical protein
MCWTASAQSPHQISVSVQALTALWALLAWKTETPAGPPERPRAAGFPE